MVFRLLGRVKQSDDDVIEKVEALVARMPARPWTAFKVGALVVWAILVIALFVEIALAGAAIVLGAETARLSALVFEICLAVGSLFAGLFARPVIRDLGRFLMRRWSGRSK